MPAAWPSAWPRPSAIAASQSGRRNHRLGWDGSPLIDRQETVVERKRKQRGGGGKRGAELATPASVLVLVLLELGDVFAVPLGPLNLAGQTKPNTEFILLIQIMVGL